MAESNRKRQSTPKNTGKSTRGAGTSRKGGSGAKRGQGKSANTEQDMGFLRAEVVIICSFAVAVLLFLSNFRLCGVVGEALRRAQLGVFGMVGFLVPILLFVGTCFHMSNEGNIHAALKLGAVILAVITVCGLLQLLFGSTPEGAKWLEYYKQSADTGRGGGWLGGVLASVLTVALGRAGAYLVLFVVLIICAVCITEKSFVSVVRSGGDKAYHYAREDMERRRENHARRQEERRQEREEQMVRGVNLEATRLTDPRDLPDIMEDEEPENVGYEPAQGGTAPAAAAADVFRGQINLPPEYQDGEQEPSYETDDVAVLADSIERHQKPGAPVKGTGRERTAAPAREPADAYLLHREDGEETIRLPRDHRTLGELEFVEDGYREPGMRAAEAEPEARPDFLRDISEEAPFEEDIPPFEEPAARVSLDAPLDGQENLYGEGLSVAEELPYAKGQSGVKGVSYAGETSYAEGLSGVSGTAYAEGLSGVEGISDPEKAPYAAKTGGREETSVYEDTAPWDTAGSGTGALSVQEDDYSQDHSEQGVNYDNIFVPEEPKRVVTAGGKVIETETELLQKKLEKKRQAAAAASESVEVAEEIRKEEEVVKKEYIFPPTTLLKRGNRNAGAFSQNEYKATAIKLQQTLRNFGVGVTVTNISCGPAVTRYELLPEQGVKVSKIVGLTDDIKLNLAAADIRIEAPIPGKSAVGIEVPNKENNVVYLRELLESDNFQNHKSRLAFAVGKDIGGQVVVTDIGKMPHLLIAGATGSGKSVCINTLIMSIIFKSKPEDVKLIMVDPKVVELSVYNGIPHLLIPVVTDPKKASGALNWAVAEMEDRYKKFASCNVRDLKGYNDRVEKLKDVESDNKPAKLPQIVIIIDELADLMMVAPGEVEESICRLAQLARAAGIHLVIATQRPSVNVITGLIKANVPSRIAFSVSSGVDSRTIIDMNGAEKLLGKGDMLFYPAGFPKPQRVQGAFVSDEEVGRVVEFLTEQGLTAQYSPEVENRIASPAAESAGSKADDGRDEYFVQAGQLIIDKDKASIGMLQRMFKIGFNRAARIMDQLAEAGVVGEEEGTKPRKVLMSPEQFQEFLEQGR